MEIIYTYEKNPPRKGEEQTYHVRQVTTAGNMSHEELREYLSRTQGVLPAHFDEVIGAITNTLPMLLASNSKVKIKGIGQFSLSLGLKEGKDENGNPIPRKITDPKAITAHYVKVKKINITPDANFKKAVFQTQVSFMENKNVLGHSDDVSRAELLVTIHELFQTQRFITYSDVYRKLPVTDYKVRKLLDGLAAEEYPKIHKEKVGNKVVFLKAGDSLK